MDGTILRPLFLLASVVLGSILCWTLVVYNSLIRKRNQVKTDLSDINIQLGKKIALVDRLIEMVREYSKHEKSTLENVTKARSALDTSRNATDSAKAENILTTTLRSLMAVVENYPKLQANQNYLDLRVDLKEIEDLIAQYREEYNRSVQKFNNAIQTFPNILISSFLGFKEEPLFEITLQQA